MTVSTTNTYSGPYFPNGVTVAFPFTFKALSEDEVVVVTVDENGIEAVVNPALYNVTLSDPGGTATFTAAPLAIIAELYVVSLPDFTQTTAFANQGAFLPTVFNMLHDRAAIRDQYLKGEVDRSLKLRRGETASALPALTDMAGKYLAFDVDGNPVASSGTGTDAGLRSDMAASGGAGLLGWIHTATGAILRSLLSWLRDRPLTPEDFGAVGDGVTDDTAAFNALAAAINAASGGTIEMSPKTYIVGLQTVQSPAQTAVNFYTFLPSYVLRFQNCTRPIIIRGNGAKLRAPDGYKYGTFLADGTPTSHTLPYTGPEIAAGYYSMIEFQNCSAPMIVEGLDLDGNVTNATVGGGWGDAGWQLPGEGIAFRNNSGKWRVRNCRIYRHPHDGVYVDEIGTLTAGLSGSGMEGCDIFENGRQAMSVTGGVGLTFTDCAFRKTRRGIPVGSAPSAGVDLEPNTGEYVRHISFTRCDFVDNVGAALLDGGSTRVSHVTLTDFRLIGTTYYTYYGSGTKYLTFNGCKIVGAMVNLAGGALGGEKFVDSLLTNDPEEAPDGLTVHSPGSNFIIQDGVAGVHLTRCEIRNAKAGTSANANFDAMVLDSCTIHAKVGRLDVFGRYRGRTRFVKASGASILFTPGGLGASSDAGNSEDDFEYIDVAAGTTTRHPSTRDMAQAVAYAADIALDFTAFRRSYDITLTGNTVLSNPANLARCLGRTGRIRVVQDGTGGRTMTFGTAWKFPGGAPTLSTAASAVDIIHYRVRSSAEIEARIDKAYA